MAKSQKVLGEEDPRIAAMREAMTEEGFLNDLNEVTEDFKHSDSEIEVL
jgi:hypothetical protein